MNSVWLWFQFIACAAVIARAGYVLCVSADAIARILGIAGSWVGLALLATVTSLPELVTGISAVAVVGAPNLALGDALGSCVFNLALLVLVDAMQPDPPLYRKADAVHLLSAAFGVVMLGFVAMSLLAGARAPALLHLGAYTPVLMVLYLVALRVVYAHERAAPVARAAERPVARGQLPWRLRSFGFAAVAAVAAGAWLPFVADGLAAAHGWSGGFVGTVFVALATSLPELAVTLASLRIGALDMAIGNLLGSNLFNVAIVAIDDLFYLGGPLLASVELSHAMTAVSAMVMTALVMIGLAFRPAKGPLRRLSWISIGLVAIYLLNALLAYLHNQP